MIAQRTTLISISFLSIVLATNVTAISELNILWTGITVPFNGVRWLLSYVILFLITSYILKWLTEEITINNRVHQNILILRSHFPLKRFHKKIVYVNFEENIIGEGQMVTAKRLYHLVFTLYAPILISAIAFILLVAHPYFNEKEDVYQSETLVCKKIKN